MLSQLHKYRDSDISDEHVGADILIKLHAIAAAIPLCGTAQSFANRWIAHMEEVKTQGRFVDPVYSWRGHIRFHLTNYIRCAKGVELRYVTVFENSPWLLMRLAIEVMTAFPDAVEYACNVSKHCLAELGTYWNVQCALFKQTRYVSQNVFMNSWTTPITDMPCSAASKEQERNENMQVQINGTMKFGRTELMAKLSEQVRVIEEDIKKAEEGLEASIREQVLPQLMMQVMSGKIQPDVTMKWPALDSARQQLKFLHNYLDTLSIGADNWVELTTATVMQLLTPHVMGQQSARGVWTVQYS